VSDANQLSTGVTSRLLDAENGKQFLAATIGEAFYFTNPRVTLPDEIPRTDKRSDLVAQLAVSAFQNWNADFGLQWNPQTESSQRVYMNVQYKPANDRVVNLSYRFEREILRQVELSTAWPITRTWNGFLREIYSIQDNKPLETFAGFEYRSCCWGLRFGGRHYVSTFGGGTDTGVFLELELIGLASVGSASDAVLRDNIRGYTPAETSARQAIGSPSRD
jgi:LPS-assembly protein